jgi:hypothetical protein
MYDDELKAELAAGVLLRLVVLLSWLFVLLWSRVCLVSLIGVATAAASTVEITVVAGTT